MPDLFVSPPVIASAAKQSPDPAPAYSNGGFQPLNTRQGCRSYYAGPSEYTATPTQGRPRFADMHLTPAHGASP